MPAQFFHSPLERSQYLLCPFLDASAEQLRRAASNFLMSVRPSPRPSPDGISWGFVVTGCTEMYRDVSVLVHVALHGDLLHI
jgi:hypothetical protein